MANRQASSRPGPAGGVRDRNRRAQRERLENAALACFLADGIATVTVDDITRAAGMAKGNFYRYAIDKAALVTALFDPVAGDIDRAFTSCARALRVASGHQLLAIYDRLAAELTTVAVRHLPRIRLYLQEARAAPSPERRPVHQLAGQLEARAIELTRLARNAGLVREVDDRVVALTVIGAVEALMYAQLTGRGVAIAQVPAMVHGLIELVLGGVRPATRGRTRSRSRRSLGSRTPRS